jgi:hypothetical protein
MTEILIEGKRVFAGNASDIGLEISRSVFDILEPDKRKADFTRTASIAGSKEADEVFMAMFDVNFTVTSTSFDPGKRAKAIISTDTLPELVGYCQLTDIEILDERRHTYKVVFYGIVADLFKNISDKKLSDIDWSDLNHDLTAANIEGSFTPTLGEGYVYPLVNYGTLRRKFPTLTVAPDRFRPWLFWKEIWDRIFNDAGTRYVSNFINSEKFKRLIYSCDEPMRVDVGTTLSQANANTNQDLTAPNDVVAFPTVVTGGANFSSNVYTAPNSGQYIVGGKLRIRVFVSTIFPITKVTTTFRLQHIRSGVEVKGFNIITEHTALNVTTDQPYSFVINNVLSGDEFRIILRSAIKLIYNTSLNILGSPRFGTVTLRDTSNGKSEIECRLSETIATGSPIDIATMAAGKLLQKDFVVGVIKQFNLFYDPQPDGTIIIEPFDDYYTNDTIDITKQLAVDREFIIKPLEQSKYKRYRYTYKESGDFLNKAHKDGYDEIYGQTEIEIDNEFAKETKITQLPWSLPVMSNQVIVPLNYSFEVIPFIANENTDKKYEGNSIPKVLVWGGLQQAIFPFGVAGGSGLTSQYPYAGQQDKLVYTTDDGIDITFDLPPAVYWKNIATTSISIIENNGLYPQYHERYIEQLTNRNSKVIECYIYLDSWLFTRMNFRSLYFIRNAYYRLYDIEGYTPEDNKPTLCRFLKVEERAKKTKVKDLRYFDNVNGFSDGRNNPIVVNRGTVVTTGDGIISTGTDNVVGGVNVLVTAINSDVQGDNITVIGGSNQQPLSDTITVISNVLDIDADDITGYTYLGVEGSPIFINIRNAPSSAPLYELKLTEDDSNIGKKVSFIADQNVDVRVSTGGDLDLAVQGGTYVYFGSTSGWKKIV